MPVIARLVDSDESHGRKVIHALNERGFEPLDPEWRGGQLTLCVWTKLASTAMR